MTTRSHEFPQPVNDTARLLDIAMESGITVHIVYQDGNGNITRRNIDPLEWVADYKIRAYCHFRNDERDFVVSRIKELKYLTNSSNTGGKTANTNSEPSKSRKPAISSVSAFEQWRVSAPEFDKVAHTPPKRVIAPKPSHSFSQVSNSKQWKNLLTYYSECLNREYLQDYIIDHRNQDNYYFFQSQEDSMWQFLVGNTSLTFASSLNGHSLEITKFVTNPNKRDQQLCVGFPSLSLPQAKIAPLFFVPCEIQLEDDKFILHSDDYELSYAILQSLNLEKEEFAVIVKELDNFEFDDQVTSIRSLQTALVEKLGELIGYPIKRREANRPRLREETTELTLYTTPCLFWASRNKITHKLIEELDELATLSWNRVPQPLKYLVNLSPENDYPTSVPIGRDKKLSVTKVNDEQRRAIHAASQLPITVVTGPPGTGKSQLVANIIANAAVDGRSVLFASRNNRAVDVVVERIKNEMHFDGMVRTGNRKVRALSASAMLASLSRAAKSQATTEPVILLDTYRDYRDSLAKELDSLREVQDLEKTTQKKIRLFNLKCKSFTPEIVALLTNSAPVVTTETLSEAKAAVSILLASLSTIQKRKNTVEGLLQNHITDNNPDHPLINDIEIFELDWGSFGNGLLTADYFPTLEAVDRYIKLWLRLTNAVSIRLSLEQAENDIRLNQQITDNAIACLPDEIKLELSDGKSPISERELIELTEKIANIDEEIGFVQKPRLSNWFGLRRGSQIASIISNLNTLLQELSLPMVPTSMTLKQLTSQMEIPKSYAKAIKGIHLLEATHRKQEKLQKQLNTALNAFSNETREQFLRLKIQNEEPIKLRMILEKLDAEIEKNLAKRQEAADEFYNLLQSNKFLLEMWGELQRVLGQDQYEGWYLTSEISLELIEGFLTQWSELLSTITIKAEIVQLQSIIQNKPSKEKLAKNIEDLYKSLTTNAIKILNNSWLKHTKMLKPDEVQHVRDYASLIKEIYEDYDRRKYSNMMSIQESHSDEIIATFPIWATTNLSIGQNMPLHAGLFDLVIIDEASQCDIPSALPLLYRAKHAVIIGDDMQLRHIATLTEGSHQLLAAEHGVATAAYGYIHNSLFDLAARSVGQHPGILMLKEHYRSHHEIIEFSNQAFYDGNLIVRTDMNNRNIPAKLLDTSCGIFWLNTPGQTIHPQGGSAQNLREFSAIKQMVPKIEKSIKSAGWNASIGIVTPYKEQKILIERWVNSQAIQNITIGTAHTFQGDEREILVFSPVLAPGISEGSLSWLTRTTNLLNVAITRARTSLIILGDFDYCMSLAQDNPYKQLAEYVQNQSHIYQSTKELPMFQLQ